LYRKREIEKGGSKEVNNLRSADARCNAHTLTRFRGWRDRFTLRMIDKHVAKKKITHRERKREREP